MSTHYTEEMKLCDKVGLFAYHVITRSSLGLCTIVNLRLYISGRIHARWLYFNGKQSKFVIDKI